MSADTQTAVDRAASLPPRAAIALMSLQLRAAEREADEAEAANGRQHTESAVAELRAKLQPRLEQRRVELDLEFEQARSEAADAIAAAHADVEARRAAAHAAEVLAASEEVVEPEPIDVDLDDLPVATPVAPMTALAPIIVDAGGLVFWPTSAVADEDDEVIVVEAPLTIPIITELTPPNDPSPFAPPVGAAVAVPGPNLVDADAFARAIASVLAAVLAERGVAQQPMAPQPYYLPYPPQQPAPSKAGFWSNAKHIDVLLLFVAMVIVLVILVAWLA